MSIVSCSAIPGVDIMGIGSSLLDPELRINCLFKLLVDSCLSIQLSSVSTGQFK